MLLFSQNIFALYFVPPLYLHLYWYNLEIKILFLVSINRLKHVLSSDVTLYTSDVTRCTEVAAIRAAKIAAKTQ